MDIHEPRPFNRDFWKRIKNLSKEGRSMRQRHIIFSILFLITLFTAVFFILLITGVFNIGNSETIALFENELNHIENNIYTDYGGLSAKSVDLAKALNISIEKILKDKNILINDLKYYPEVYNELLDLQCQTLITELLHAKSSGAFIILDGTINPNLPNAAFSKAGIHIRNMEPNTINLESPYLYMLRGSAEIAKNNDILLHSQWEMEFDINDDAFFIKTINTARNNKDVPLSKLYYWCPNTVLPNTTDRVMLCTVPLIASDGTIYGVCGFEVSSLLFKSSYIPNSIITDMVFGLLLKNESDVFDCSSSFMAAQYPAIARYELTDAKLCFKAKPNSLIKYFSPTNQFMGLHKVIALYADDSPYNDEEWVVSVMVPEKDFERALSSINQKLMLLLLLLLLIGIATSFWFSKFYLRPVTETISKMKQTKASEIEKTNILEIDGFLEFCSQQDSKIALKESKSNYSFSEAQNTEMFKSFLANIDTLSPAERAVFDLYIEGYTGKEIAEKLYLSINTIKTHNKRIYKKMNVSSRNELMVYIRMMKEMDSKG